MHARLRYLLPLLVAALWAIVPASGEDTGGGDSGVWILPRSTFVSGVSMISSPNGPGTGTEPRDFRYGLPRHDPVSMRVSPEVQLPPVATITEPISSLRIPVYISGGVATLRPEAMALLIQTPGATAVGTLIDRQGRGYLLTVTVDGSQDTVDIAVY